MSFRIRVFLAILIAVLAPLGALAYGVRQEMERRLRREYEERVVSMARIIETDLTRERTNIDSRLHALAADLAADNRFRLAAVQGAASSRPYLLDYASAGMSLAGLSMLQLQDSSGKILSSGHFRNEFDRLQPDLPHFLASNPETMTLVRTRTPEASLLALARVDSFRVAGRRFTLVGGIDADAQVSRLSRSRDLTVELSLPGAEHTTAAARVVREIPLPYLDLLSIDGPSIDSSRFVITHSLATLDALRQSIDRWFLLAVALTGALALALAAWLSSRVSRPLRDLARKTAQIDLDRLDQTFDSERQDEIGSLSRLLGGMTERLRASTAKLREAERRAAVGDLAQQVNHDIKNGLAPIRNVLRHFAQIAQQEPGSLAAIFEERKGTLDSSVEYLETLARNYARLSPAKDPAPCDVNALVEQVLRSTPGDGTVLQAELSKTLPQALGDSLMVRRVLENLVGNAVDSVSGRAGGKVTVRTDSMAGAGGLLTVTITVADTGPGMTREELDHAFDDFYTTKPNGTGLGLSIVRRLVLDLNGTLQVKTEPGAGTSFVVVLPTAAGRSST